MTSQDPWNSSVDVVVVGIGAAGAAAAIAAHDAGARVLVLEKMSERLAGGNTRLSGGIWFDNTDPGRAEVYLRNLCGEHEVPEDVIRVWARETAANTDWMKRLGVEVGHFLDYRPEYPELDGSDCYGGYFGVAGRLGHGLLYDALLSAIRARGIELRFDTPVVELVHEHGDSAPARITGVIAESGGARLRIRARCGVVLATGGFESNPEMVSDYLGLVGCPYWGTPAATGDGHKMAQKAGADLWHMNNMAAMTGFSVPGYEAGFAALGLWSYKSYLFVGMDGRRFVDETAFSRHGHALLHGQYEIYPYRRAHVLFDETARQAGPLVPSRRDFGIGWNILVRDYEWSADNLAEIERGWLLRADSVEELANRLRLEPASLRATVELYNRYCAGGCDEQFNRPAETMAPLATPPFYAFTSAPVLGWTNGGLRRDADARVLDTTGDVIPGLYAAGTASGTYSWCKDGGFHIADALAFGRVAGRNAAADRE